MSRLKNLPQKRVTAIKQAVDPCILCYVIGLFLKRHTKESFFWQWDENIFAKGLFMIQRDYIKKCDVFCFR